MRQWLKSARAFHDDEEGLEALQVVMIVAVAAVCLVAIVKLWPTVQSWFKSETGKVMEMKSE